ncbi:MAG TPA: cytochrome c [Thermoanaerobaculia bacterium]
MRRLPLAAWLLLLFPFVSAGCRNTPLPEEARVDRDVAAGERIFQRKCASCHNSNGDGRTVVAGHFPYANLVDGVWRSDGSPAAIENQIRNGRDPMPRFEGKLTDEEIRQTVEYVEALSHSSQAAASQRATGAPAAPSAP